MALSEREQKLLEEMERNLREDSQFASRVSEVGSSNQSSGKLVGGVLLLLLGVGLLILAVILQVAFFGVAAFLVMLMGLVIASANFSLPKMPEIQKSQNPSRYEDRWNQRFNNNE
jgi:predicted lipid-binding transport protein (Tim44 family)